MRRTIVINIILAVTLLILSLTSAVAQERLSVTIPIKGDDTSVRVTSFKVTVTYGWVVSLPTIPKGWSVFIKNDPVWKTIVDGHISIGSGAEYTNFFKDFLVVEKIIPEKIPFDIDIEIVTTTDFEKEKHVIYTMKDLKLTKLQKDTKR